jgi:2-polyprenyl-3-methyl-5-hydroxy-6-metoxy-1,4-benzoquinol methylase
MTEPLTPNDETRAAWDANAEVWDAKMGDDGNDFANLLVWPAVQRLMQIQPGQKILDAACGNGLFSRRLAALGAEVTAFDFSTELIKLAKARNRTGITYQILDATDEQVLLGLGRQKFDAVLCNMALMDIADIVRLFRVIPQLLKPSGAFTFSILHPAFNNSSTAKMGEEIDDNGTVKTIYSVKVSRYMTPYQAHGVALINQPKPQLYFERPLQYYFNLAFENGFVLDGFEECAFPAGSPNNRPLSWGGLFSEIPAVLVARMRLLKSK